MDWTTLGWRDGILLLVALAAIYLVVMLLKLTNVGRQRLPRPEQEAPAPLAPQVETVSPLRRRTGADVEPASVVASAAAVSAYAEEAAATESFAVLPAPTFEWDEVDELLGDVAGASPPELAAAHATGFGEHLAEHLARSDMEMEVQRMRDEMERMRAEMEELRVARRVSPQYAEAMELAQRGLNAQDVADRLGISLAEAELVHALSRGEKNFDEGEDHGADEYATNDGFDAFSTFSNRRVS